MKGHIILALMLIVSVNLLPQSANLPFMGEGTEISPYQIANPDHLYWLSQNPSEWHKHFEQTNDLVFSDYSGKNDFLPIGNENNPFTGTYNGGNHSIANLVIRRKDSDDTGLFGYAKGALIQSLTLSSLFVEGRDNTGGILGFGENCVLTSNHVSGAIIGGEKVGGIVGKALNTRIESSSVSGNVIGDFQTGGLVGDLSGDEASVSLSFTSGSVSGAMSIGGLVGISDLSSVSNSYSTASVDGEYHIGGLIGNNGGDVRYCYSTGSVEGISDVGGLIGSNTGSVEYSFWDTESSGQILSSDGAGLTTYEMLWEDSFTNWSFNENPWAMKNPNSYVREVYPHFHWQEGPGEHNHAEAMIKLFNPNVNHHWESFPRLETENDYYYLVNEILNQLEEAAVSVSTNNDIQYDMEITWDFMDWSGSQMSFFSKFGYMLRLHNIKETDNLFVRGVRIPETTGIPLTAHRENYIGYFVRETQHFFSAFGGYLDNIDYVLAQNWGAYKINGQWWLPPHAYLEYGKMYIVRTDRNWSGEFHWQKQDSPEIRYQYRDAEYFKFRDLSGYGSILIESMEDDEDILEVGVYVGDECLGAAVFEQTYPFEIRLYSRHIHNRIPLRFVIYRGHDTELQRVNIVDNLDFKTGGYQTTVLRAGEQRVWSVRLSSEEIEIEPDIDPLIDLFQNSPNPFILNDRNRSNSTEIPFYIKEQREVTLTVYNIKGQRVIELFSGVVNAGNHTVAWNGHNDRNQQVGSGVYFYRLESGNKMLTRKLLLIR